MSSTNLAKKEQVQNKQKGKKGLKENILTEFENNNNEKQAKELALKFNPPICTNCPNHKADRVCINKGCGPVKYMQIICGKCHADIHAKATQKPEIDVKEYLVKFRAFISEQNELKDPKQLQMIDSKDLKEIFEEVNNIRETLSSLKIRLSKVIEGYSSAQQMHYLLQGSITIALSLCEYENMQEQLRSIKEIVLFEKNQFLWNNDTQNQFGSIRNSFGALEDSTVTVNKIISQYPIGNVTIDLSVLQAQQSTLFSNKNKGLIKAKNGVLSIGKKGSKTANQFYLDYKLDSQKKYKMRFKFTGNPECYIMVGIMSFHRVHTEWVYGVNNEFFCKRFFHSNPKYECGKITRGSDLSNLPKDGYQVEMRVDFKENYIDFSDFPDHKNINTNHKHFQLQDKDNGQYVIAFALLGKQFIIVESLEEISQIDQL